MRYIFFILYLFGAINVDIFTYIYDWSTVDMLTKNAHIVAFFYRGNTVTD
jgi:hypothetical protein